MTENENKTPEKENKTTAKKKDERVAVYIEPTSGDDDPNLVVGINGKMYLLPKGETSMVPPAVAAEIERARKARKKQDKTIAKKVEEASK